MAAQLHVYEHRYRLAQIEEGICLFVFGLAKKVLIADTVSHLWYDIIGVWNGAELVTAGVGIANASTPLVWLGLLAYSLQLYFCLLYTSIGGVLRQQKQPPHHHPKRRQKRSEQRHDPFLCHCCTPLLRF